MEEEGISYYFTHSPEGHRLVVTDRPLAFPELPGAPTVEFEPWGSSGGRRLDRITSWEKAQELRPDKVTLRDHCFELPGNNLEAEDRVPERISAGRVSHVLRAGTNGRLEIYDYPGAYAHRFDGVDPSGGDRKGDLAKILDDRRRTARIRVEEQAASAMTIRGAGHCRSLAAGHRFTLARHHNADGPYVITEVVHEAKQDADYRSGADDGVDYRNRFTCIPAALPLRPSRQTPRPTIHGTQTATVVGPEGEEIFTDKYGRVKVQFHWDREGKNDDKSSCWIRVATPWAGTNWGSINIPRIGQEVVVAFEEGDPDRPIIVGSVYNAETMPPFELPANKTISGLKSQTHKGGGYNELVFEDTGSGGQQLIRLHGQYDMESTVEHDLREHVLNDRSRDVTNNETITVGVDQTETIGSNRTQTIGSNHTETIGSNRTLTVGANETAKIGSNQTTSIGSNKTETVGMMSMENVGIAEMESIGVAKALNVGVAFAVNVGAVMNTIVGISSSEQVGVSKSVVVGSKIELKCGASRIVMDSGGKVTIEGTEFLFSASGNVKINGAIIDLN